MNHYPTPTQRLDPSLASNPEFHDAVERTLSRQLDNPEFVLFSTRTELGRRAYEILSTLGYAKEMGRLPHIHVKARDYLEQFGETYITNLEAIQRLTR